MSSNLLFRALTLFLSFQLLFNLCPKIDGRSEITLFSYVIVYIYLLTVCVGLLVEEGK